MMNHNRDLNVFSNDENDGETDNYVTCPLLQLKYSRPRKPVRYVIYEIIIFLISILIIEYSRINIYLKISIIQMQYNFNYFIYIYFSRLGQKGRSLKRFNDNQPLFENKTAEADLGYSFQTHNPENVVKDFEKLDLVHQTPFVQPVVKIKNDSGIETPSDTLNNLKNLNIRPTLSLSTKRSLYSNKENLPEQKKEELKTQQLSQSNISSCSFTVKDNVKAITNKSPIPEKDDTVFVSPEISRYNYDTSLYHSIRETTIVPESLNSNLSINSNSQINDSLSTKTLGCAPLDSQQVDSQPIYALELSPAAKHKNFVISARSPICRIPVDFVQDGEFKRPINSTSNVCVKCANDNFITVKGINYSILNTLGHGGSSVVYEVNILSCLY